MKGASLEGLFRFMRILKWRLFTRPTASTIEQVKKRKAERLASGISFKDEPKVSVIVQSFNQVRNIATLESRLRLAGAEELIVCEDGSLDGSLEEWLRRLDKPNDFLIHSNDMHEIRAYSRAIDYSRGSIFCLMQDDDRPPVDGSWLQDALEIFARYPRLAVLGGWCGFNCFFEEVYNAPWLPPGQGKISTIDPYTKLPLMFVENVNIGPYFFRKDAYEALGGFDLSFSAAGAPGICFESEICYRAWNRGYEVALTNIPVKIVQGYGSDEYILPGGTLLWGNEARQQNERQNKRKIAALYGSDLPEIQERIKRANDSLVKHLSNV